MKLPNKVTSYSESTLGKICPVLEELEKNDLPVYELYLNTSKWFNSYADYIEVIDCLYALQKIEYFADKGVLHYVKWNILWPVSSKENWNR